MDTEKEQRVKIIGQVLHKRTASKRRFFIDIAEDRRSSQGQIDPDRDIFERKSFALNSWILGPDRYYAALKSDESRIHVGDTVQVTVLDSDRLTVLEFEILEKWSEYHRKIGFVSIPPPIIAKENGICKSWKSSRNCSLGQKCPFSHEISKTEENTHKNNDLVSRQKRASIFVDFIYEQFELEKADKEITIIDVAGGRGDIAFEFFVKSRSENDRKVSVVIVDPRGKIAAEKRRRWQHRYIKREGLSEDDLSFDVREEYFNDNWIEKWMSENSGRKPDLITGMHPDQATEPIFDTALKHDISFAVVPCCVFFTDETKKLERQKSGSNTGNSFEEFCRYLKEKAGPENPIREIELPFKGKNKVLFFKK